MLNAANGSKMALGTYTSHPFYDITHRNVPDVSGRRVTNGAAILYGIILCIMYYFL